MIELTTRDLRQRLADQLAGLSGWTESRYPFDLFGRDPKSLGHKSFAVGLTRSTAGNDRQHPARLGLGTTVETVARVRFTLGLRPKDKVGSVDDALDAEHLLIRRVMAAERRGMHIQYRATSRREVVPSGEHYLGEIEFTALHRISLE